MSLDTYSNQVRTPRSGTYRVSLIVPVFNTAEYLSETLASIKAQSIFPAVEVILVDDGSTDDSPQICADFAANHQNVMLIRQENAGAGVARNKGLDRATAEYIAFLDADDILPPKSIERRLNAMLPWTDIVIGNIETFPVPSRWPWSGDLEQGTRHVDITVVPRLLGGAGPANKLFRADFLLANGIRFAEGKRFEDAFAVLPALLRSDRLTLIPDTVYMYRKRADDSSLTDSLWSNLDGYFDHLELEAVVKNELAPMGRARRKAGHLFMVRSIEGFLVRARESMDDDDLRGFFNRAREIYQDLPIGLITAVARTLEHRVIFHQILNGDYESYRDCSPLALDVADDGLTLRPIRKSASSELISKELDQLLSIDKVVAFAERARSVGGRVILAVSLRVFGIKNASIGGTTVQIVQGSQAVSLKLPLTPRASNQDNNYVTFEANVPIEVTQLTPNSDLALKVSSDQSAKVLRLQHTVGFIRSSHVIKTPKRWLQFVPSGEKSGVAVEIAEANSEGELSRRWRRAVLRSDIRAVLRKKAYWRWRILHRLTGPGNVWLFGERGDTASDNARVLFEWTRANRPEVRPRFVLERNSPAWDTFGSKSGLVAKGSFKHKYLMLKAKVLVSSQDIDNYLFPPNWKPKAYRDSIGLQLNQRRVFLQHGVIHNGVGEQLHSRGTGLDMFLCSSPQEKQYLLQTSGYTDAELMLVGMPRLDQLFRQRAQPKTREILLMPTWRSYLVAPSFRTDSGPKEDFQSSEFFQFYSTFLQDNRLHEMLESHGLKLRFLPHYEVAEQFQFDSAHQSVVVDNGLAADVPALLRSTPLLITDYSSVAFDVAFAGAPVILAHFDIDRFYSDHYGKGWYDPEEMSLGPTATSVDGLLLALRNSIESGFQVDDRYAERVERYFAFHDDNNSERTFNEIKDLVEGI
ncbi:CDP-glycerol glycerophosphotransferase (TagB/SpsB family) [Mycolicibacterium mucogenicum 261Sha1.1M5]|nr:CDP-glycerol glycerophosphotransferase (TagB/SpsB family) [Mycolicibacterium mucogenicum 261Sha1.1M5]